MADDYNYANDLVYVNYDSDYTSCSSWLNTDQGYKQMNIFDPTRSGHNNIAPDLSTTTQPMKKQERYQPQQSVYDMMRTMQGYLPGSMPAGTQQMTPVGQERYSGSPIHFGGDPGPIPASELNKAMYGERWVSNQTNNNGEHWQSRKNLYDATQDMHNFPPSPYHPPYPSYVSYNNPYNNPPWMFQNTPPIPSEYNRPKEGFTILPTGSFQHEGFMSIDNQSFMVFMFFVLCLCLVLVLKQLYTIQSKIDTIDGKGPGQQSHSND